MIYKIYTNKFENLDEMISFREKYKLFQFT